MLKNYVGFIKVTLKHKYFVFREMCGYGLYWQGLIHDLSKFSPTELKQAKYYDGIVSPTQSERQEKGYSLAWIHHVHHNPHHWQHWRDPSTNVVAPIPEKYIKEMTCDIIAASKTYLGDKFTPAEPLAYVQNSYFPQELKIVLLDRIKSKLRIN